MFALHCNIGVKYCRTSRNKRRGNGRNGTEDGGQETEDRGRAPSQAAEDGSAVTEDARSWREDGSTYAIDAVPCSTSGEYK